ncbi:tetratricopeptide repeat protein [Streptacidiphilus anmyonensis]|uniref:tetratricopeptide repeat protein n=1 Tax=Streptacidiphilus anmyonensis TaxID=405782 RepID=UPI0005A602D0|nr:tetratricopeptide repeat protein [Streptacidiphilus anmyonensis]
MSVDTPEALVQALRANDERPYGKQRTVTAEELAEAAEQLHESGRLDDPDLLVVALMDLQEAYTYDAEQRKSPVVFAKVLKLWDTKPEAFNEWARTQLFWRFKWVASALRGLPEVPLESVRRWDEEMKSRYVKAELGLQPYYAQRFYLAWHLGGPAGTSVEDAFELWTARPRTRYSDCVACELRSRADFHAHRGDDARALEIWKPVLEGESTCSEEPWSSHAHALLPFVRAGRLDEARSSHLVGYRFSRGKTSQTTEVGLHVEFCALTRNEARGLEILAENRDLWATEGNPLGLLNFRSGVQLLLTRLDADGHGELPVSGPPGANWTVASLLAHVRALNEELAGRFDARNGTDGVSARVRARVGQQPLLAEPLALGVRAPALPGRQSGAPVPGAVPAPARPAGPGPATARPGAAQTPRDFVELVRQARELYRSGHPDANAFWLRVAELIEAEGFVLPDDAAIGPLALLRGEVAQQRAAEAMERRDRVAARAEMERAVALFTESGHEGRRIAGLARLAVVDSEPDDGRTDWAALDRLREAAVSLRAADPDATDPAGLLTVLQSRTYAAHHALYRALQAADGTEPHGTDPVPTVEEALARFETENAALRESAAGLGMPHRVSLTLQYRADVAARLGRPEEAEQALLEALRLLEEAEQPWRAPRALVLLGQVRMQQQRPQEAVEVFHRALGEAARWPDGSFPYGPASMMLGQACAMSGDNNGAVRALTEAAARFDRGGDVEDAVSARLNLANMLRRSGHTGDAVAVLESAVADADASGLEETLRAQLRLDLARGLRALDEHRDAAEEFLRLADAVSGWENQDVHTMAACEATVALAEAGRLDAARAALERALTSHAVAPRADQMAATLRELARQLMEAGGADALDEALARIAQSERVGAEAVAAGLEVTAWFVTGAAHYERGRAYAEAQRPEEALAAFEQSIVIYTAVGQEAEEPRAESLRLAAVVEAGPLQRRDAALQRLGAGIARCEQAGLAQAAKILTGLRDRIAAQTS